MKTIIFASLLLGFAVFANVAFAGDVDDAIKSIKDPTVQGIFEKLVKRVENLESQNEIKISEIKDLKDNKIGNTDIVRLRSTLDNTGVGGCLVATGVGNQATAPQIYWCNNQYDQLSKFYIQR